MILVDANLLVYAAVAKMPKHAAAKEWLDDRLNAAAPVGIPWQSLTAFLRIVTNPRIFSPPVASHAAWEAVKYWLRCKPVWTPQPGDKHTEVLDSLFESVSPTKNLIPDASLAALAIEHGLVLCSCDGDFARFPGLRWEDPLAR